MTFRVSLLLFAAFACSASQFPPAAENYAGEWVLNRDASDNLDQAIEKAIARMSFVARPIARMKLKRKNVAFPRMTITVNGQGLRIQHQQGMNVLYPAPSVSVPGRAPDDTQMVSKLVFDPSMDIVYDAEDGRREDRYTLSPDGSQIAMNVTLTSARLPQPLSYKLVFGRAGH